MVEKIILKYSRSVPNPTACVACPWIHAACPCGCCCWLLFYCLLLYSQPTFLLTIVSPTLTFLTLLVSSSVHHPPTISSFLDNSQPLSGTMLTLAMPSIPSNLGPLALWALVGLASMTSFAAASGDSSSEDGGAAAASSSEDTDDALGNNSSTEYFSVPAFFITFRETIEVCGMCVGGLLLWWWCAVSGDRSDLRLFLLLQSFVPGTRPGVCVLPEICHG